MRLMSIYVWKGERTVQTQINVFAQNSIVLRGISVLYFDPFHIPEDFHDADFVLITHPHWDHFSLVDLLKVRKEDTCFIVPKEVLEELLDIGVPEDQILVVKPNETYHFGSMKLHTVPAYNKKKEHHPKEKDWMGYVVTLDELTYYVAGDTDALGENDAIEADVIFLPVGGTYTMDALEASAFANKIKPKLAIPTHYLTVVGSLEDAKQFCALLDQEIDSKIFYENK